MREFKSKNVMPQLAVRESAHGPSNPHPAIVSGAVETFGAPDPAVTARERDARLRAMVDRYLDFVLYEFEEMNMSEIADVLEIPRGTVASRLRRARGEFRERVAALEGLARGERGDKDERKR